MKEIELYVVRHGKTMFNTLQRVQGWCDTPLTEKGVEGIIHTGIGLKDTQFSAAFSSDSGRAIETCRLLLNENNFKTPHHTDPRIREWCFGSLEGGYDAELWGVIPRVLNFSTYDEMVDSGTTFEDICNGIYKADTANWAETYDELTQRIWAGFEDIAHYLEKNGGGKALVVSHGLTIALLLHLIDSNSGVRIDIDNGSVSHLIYKDGEFTTREVASTKYTEHGRQLFGKVHP